MQDPILEKYNLYRQAIADKVTGKIVPEHDEEGHKYRFVDTGTLVRSVTTKIIVDRPHLVPWAVRIAFEWLERRWPNLNEANRDSFLKGAQLASSDIRDDAGDVGRQGHEVIENWCQRWIDTGLMHPDIKMFIPDIVNADPRVFAIARSCERLFKENPDYMPLALEILVGDEYFNSAGTLDALVMNMKTGDVELWDWKSSNDVHDTYAIQVAAYMVMFQNMTGLKIDKLKIAHLSKDYDKPTLYVVPDLAKAFEAYKGISSVYDYLYDGQPKLIKDVVNVDIEL